MAHELSEQQGVDALVGTEADEGPADLRDREPVLDSGLGGDGLEDVTEAGVPQGLELRANLDFHRPGKGTCRSPRNSKKPVFCLVESFVR